MIKRNIPNFLTCGSIVTGSLGIVAVFTNSHANAIYFVLVAGVFDFLDGLVARALKVSSPMGKELDSLSDMVSFGALPALYLFVLLQNIGFEIVPYVALLVVPFSAWRLAQFNIDDSQADRFIGVPTPASAIMITATTFLTIELNEIVWIFLTLTSCFMLVMNVEMIALKFKNFKIHDNIWRYLVIVLCISLPAFFGQTGIAFVIPSYILLSLVANFTSKSGV